MTLECELMKHGLSFELDTLYDCCISHHGNLGQPIIKKNYYGEILNWDEIFDHKKKLYLKQLENNLPECEGCIFLKENNNPNIEKYISWLMFNQSKLCNSNCVYCGDNSLYKENFYDVYPVVKDLIGKKHFKNGGLVIFQGGEPTLMKNFDKILDIFVNINAEIKINSSGIKYSEAICNAMKKGNTLVCISLDSANKEDYQKIKLNNNFDIVIENIKKYIACQNEKSLVKIKYILVPEFNDTVEQIDKFFEEMKELNIKHIIADVEIKYAAKNNQKDVSPHIIYLLDYMKKKAEEENFNFEIYSFAQCVLQERLFPEDIQIFSNKTKFIETINSIREKNRHKNIDYIKGK